MRQIERVVMCALVGAGMGIAGFSFMATSRTASGDARSFAPEAAKIATCDVYFLVEKLVDTDQYAPARTAEQDRIKQALAPLETELASMEKDLESMQRDLQNANPQDVAAQSKYQGFQEKRGIYQTKTTEYGQRRQQLFDGYSELIAGQFADAYKKVSAEMKRIADERGFTYVLAQKTGDIKAREPRALVEEFLSRPVTIAPADADITEAVRTSLKLPERGAAPANPILPQGEGSNAPAPGATPKP